MPDPIARERLNKKMLDRCENEGGRIATDIRSADAPIPTNKDKDHGKNLSSRRANSTVGAPASPTKRRKPTGK